MDRQRVSLYFVSATDFSRELCNPLDLKAIAPAEFRWKVKRRIHGTQTRSPRLLSISLSYRPALDRFSSPAVAQDARSAGDLTIFLGVRQMDYANAGR